MSDMIIENLRSAFKKEKTKRADLLFVIDKLEMRKETGNIKSINILEPNQREDLSRFLNEYKPCELLLVRCKESFQIEELYFKKDNYYVLTFAGILKTYEEVPFYIHDINVTRSHSGTIIYVINHDAFRIKTKYLFTYLEVIKSLGMNKSNVDKEYEYIYFNYKELEDNCDVVNIFSNQMSVYNNNKVELTILMQTKEYNFYSKRFI